MISMVDHGIVIETKQAKGSGGALHRASCLCGYTSRVKRHRRLAVAAGIVHLAPGDLDERDLATYGVTIDDEGMAMRRQRWMSDDQWRFVSTEMSAWWRSFWKDEMGLDAPGPVRA